MNIQKAFKTFISTALVLTAVNVNAEEKSLEARVSELEAQSMLNYFTFGGLLETRYDSIKSTRTQNALLNQGAIDSSTQNIRLKSSLDANANVSDRIKFYSRYTASKTFNTLNTSGSTSPIFSEAYQGRDYNSAAVYVEKAYADYTFFRNDDSSAVLSFGRLPTSDGPPINMINGRPRQGTFALLAYNANFDGFGLSYNKKLQNDQSLSFRLLYTPLSAVNRGGTTGSYAYLNSYSSTSGFKINNLTDISSVIVEYNKANAGFAENLSVIYHSVFTGKFGFADKQVYSSASGAIESSIQIHTLTTTMDNIMNSNLDFGLSLTSTQITNSGAISGVPVISEITGSAVGTTTVYGIGAKSQGETIKGTETLANLKYRFSNKYALGAEYLINKDGYSSSFTNDDVTSYYRTQGKAYQIYALVKPESELTLRFGYTNQKWDKTTQTIGPSNDTDLKNETYYTNIRLDF